MSPTSTSSVIDEETVRLVNLARERMNRTPMNDADDDRNLGVATLGGGAVAVLPNQVTPDLTYLSPLNIRFNDEDEDFFLEPGAFDVWMPHALLNVQVNAATPNAEVPYTDTDVLFGLGVSANNSTTNNESNLHVNETRAATPNAQVPYTDNDVLFGQGGLVNKHPGNRRFRSLADDFRQPYNAISSREEKRQLVQRFVANVRANGARFWDKDDNGTYVEVDVDNEFYTNKFRQLIREDPVEARDKAKQRAIRRAEEKRSSQGA